VELTRLVLASNSPRRQELLGRLGLAFVVRVAAVDESEQPAESPVEMVVRLAREKAAAVPLAAGELLIAADTTVDLAGEVLGKPQDEADARRMLLAMRGRPHAVHTGIALRRDGETALEVVTTGVLIRPYTAAEVEAYIASGGPLDKAGAYGIQDWPFCPVERIEGCYLNVMGLPLCHLARGLLRWGVPLPALPPPYCRDVLGQPCPVALF
jgi:MAF protein